MRVRTELDPAAEDGVALVGAMLAVVILSGISVVFVITAMGQSRFSAESRDRELALHVAETGAEQLVAILNTQPTHPAAPPDPSVPYPTTGDAAQRAWALGQWQAALSASPSPIVAAPGGRALAMRPVSAGAPLDVVIGVGEVLGALGPERRVVRLNYDRGYYRPNLAFLSGGELHIGGNSDVTGGQANVHANGNLSFFGTDSYVQGASTTSASCSHLPPQCTAGQPLITIPRIDARTLYARRFDQPDWFDLCPDGPNGTIRGPAPTGGAPCTGPVWTAGNRGWSLLGNTWTMVRTGSARGTYYVYRRNAAVAGNIGSAGSALPVTVIVEKDAAGPEHSGNFTLSGGPTIQPWLSGVLAIADRDVIMEGNADSVVNGFIGAAEQVRMAGNGVIYGSVVAEYQPHSPTSPVEVNTITGHTRLHYDGGMTVPLEGLVRITSWNEL